MYICLAQWSSNALICESSSVPDVLKENSNLCFNFSHRWAEAIPLWISKFTTWAIFILVAIAVLLLSSSQFTRKALSKIIIYHIIDSIYKVHIPHIQSPSNVHHIYHKQCVEWDARHEMLPHLHTRLDYLNQLGLLN